MADKTGISWTDATWNCVRGCTRVSAGCVNCYAEAQAARIVRMGRGKPTAYDKLVRVTAGGEARWTGEVRLVPEQLAWPLRKRKPLRIFVNSMSDLFHESLTNEQIAAVFGVMAACPQHTFQVLTKRARRMREWFEWLESKLDDDVRPYDAIMAETTRVIAQDPAWKRYLLDNDQREDECFEPWPLPNVWLGVSVENQAAADERIPELLQTPAAIRFLSCEPLIGPVDLKGWGDQAPSPVGAAPESWAEFVWPEWVPGEQRRQIEGFWSASDGRGPRAWLRDHVVQQVPATGARITCAVSKDGWAKVNKMATSGASGRYLHSWNNIGRIITDDGQTVCASGGSGSGWLSKWLDKDGEYRSKLHWVIAGCESGDNARPCDVDWLRSLRDQCDKADVAFFLKQAVQQDDIEEVCEHCRERVRYHVCGPSDTLCSCACTVEGPEAADWHPPLGFGDGSRRKPGGLIELPYLDGVQHAASPVSQTHEEVIVRGIAAGMTGSQEIQESMARELIELRESADIGCARHAGVSHGKEAEELRSGIEKLLKEAEADAIGSRTVGVYPLQRLLDEVDARDSLAHLEAQDAAASAELSKRGMTDAETADLLAKNIAALTEDVAKQRAVIERLTKERDEALMLHQDVQIQAIDRGASYQEARAEADRLRSCLRNFESVLKGWLDPAHGVPTAPGAMKGALAYWIDTIREQLANPGPARSNDLRSDYLAAHLWCNQHGVKAVIDGKPATLADRVKLLAASVKQLNHELTLEARCVAARDAQLERLQPLRHILRSWDWAALLKDERIPDEAVLPVLRAFATVERNENEAAKAKEGGRG